MKERLETSRAILEYAKAHNMTSMLANWPQRIAYFKTSKGEEIQLTFGEIKLWLQEQKLNEALDKRRKGTR